MHTITVTFEDKEFEDLKDAKGKTSWHDFILENMKKAKAYSEYLAKVESGEIEVLKK